jgi:UDP-3-O-acyl N-acetylglucosamine deacetylase
MMHESVKVKSKTEKNMKKQKTLAGSAQFSGIALHTGVRATLRITPAPVNTGILFCRVDLPDRPFIPGSAKCVVDVQRGTTIAVSKTAIVYTVEHILSALHAWEIDNCIVEMDGLEPPIADGSALPYYNMVAEAGGAVEQEAEVKSFTPPHPVLIQGGQTQIAMFPDTEKLTISCITSFKGCPIDPQFFEYELDRETYLKEIAPGRTFVNYADLKQLLAMGLVKGGSLDAAAIINDGAIICKEQLRFQTEIVRHKILDMIGDLKLTGMRLTGRIIAIRPGHPKNVELARTLIELASKEA